MTSHDETARRFAEIVAQAGALFDGEVGVVGVSAAAALGAMIRAGATGSAEGASLRGLVGSRARLDALALALEAEATPLLDLAGELARAAADPRAQGDLVEELTSSAVALRDRLELVLLGLDRAGIPVPPRLASLLGLVDPLLRGAFADSPDTGRPRASATPRFGEDPALRARFFWWTEATRCPAELWRHAVTDPTRPLPAELAEHLADCASCRETYAATIDASLLGGIDGTIACPPAEDLVAYADGASAAVTASVIARHERACAACAEAVRALRRAAGAESVARLTLTYVRLKREGGTPAVHEERLRPAAKAGPLDDLPAPVRLDAKAIGRPGVTLSLEPSRERGRVVLRITGADEALLERLTIDLHFADGSVSRAEGASLARAESVTIARSPASIVSVEVTIRDV